MWRRGDRKFKELVGEEVTKRLDAEIKRRVADAIESDLFLAALQKRIDEAKAALTDKMLKEVEQELAEEKQRRLAFAFAALPAQATADPPPPPPPDEDPTAPPLHIPHSDSFPSHSHAAAHPQYPLASLSLPPPPPAEELRAAEEAAARAKAEAETAAQRARAAEEERQRLSRLEELQEQARQAEDKQRREREAAEIKKKEQALILGKGSKGKDQPRAKLSFSFGKSK